MTNKLIIAGIGIIIVGAAAGYYFWSTQGAAGKPALNTAAFICDQEKTVKASFYTDSVALTLSDGRTITLPQLISASGARYGNGDESFVFWNKGDMAFITEGLQHDETYSNCEVEVAGQEPRSTYASSTMGISVKYPKSYTVGVTYQYTGFPKKPILGVKFVIPESVSTSTNLSHYDTGVSIEQLPRALHCTADIYLPDDVKAQGFAENGVAYTVATSSGAGAGNFYEETVYALTDSKPCTAVRYFIHSTNIGNYPEGTVREFDRAALLAAFDKIRTSLRLSAQQ